MENGMDYIEDYFGKEATTEEIRQFEQYILEDPAFADEVAFYLGARQVARDLGEGEKKQRFLDLYHQAPSSRPLRTIGRAGWGAIASAVFGALLFSWNLCQTPAGAGEQANW